MIIINLVPPNSPNCLVNKSLIASCNRNHNTQSCLLHSLTNYFRNKLWCFLLCFVSIPLQLLTQQLLRWNVKLDWIILFIYFFNGKSLQPKHLIEILESLNFWIAVKSMKILHLLEKLTLNHKKCKLVSGEKIISKNS